MTDASNVSVADAPERHRFELTVDGELAGICEYTRGEEIIVLAHTEVFDGYGGRGLGGTLVSSVLDTVRAWGLSVRPDCPYVASYIAKHRDEYGDLA